MTRSGTQKAVTPELRILRIAVILGGNFIEERLVREFAPITIGQSPKATFCVPVEGLPREWELFAVDNGQYILQFSDAMEGRVSEGNTVDTLESLKNKGVLKKENRFQLPLTDQARGKIVLGTLTLLFQFVVAPPLQPRPRLPASVRGSITDRLEPQLAIIMAISLILHLGIAIYAMQMDLVVRDRTDRLHQRFVAEQYEARVIETFDQPQAAESGGKVEKTTEARKSPPARAPVEKPDKPAGGEAEPSDAAIEKEIATSAFLKTITGGSNENGRYGEMAYSDQGAGLNKSLDNVRRNGGAVASVGREGRRGTRGPRSGELGTEAGSGKITGPDTGVNTGGKGEEELQSLAKYDVIDVGGEVTLNPEDVAKRIRSKYLAGIKRCHQRALKLNPGAQGRINIAFTIGPSGRVTQSSIDGFDPVVDACIKSLTSGWLFGIPKDDSGKPTTASFRIPLVLKPGS